MLHAPLVCIKPPTSCTLQPREHTLHYTPIDVVASHCTSSSTLSDIAALVACCIQAGSSHGGCTFLEVRGGNTFIHASMHPSLCVCDRTHASTPCIHSPNASLSVCVIQPPSPKVAGVCQEQRVRQWIAGLPFKEDRVVTPDNARRVLMARGEEMLPLTHTHSSSTHSSTHFLHSPLFHCLAFRSSFQ